MTRIEHATRSKMLADPGLRAAFYTQRNRVWAGRTALLLRPGTTRFVAVAAAHMAGGDSLLVLLRAAGFTIARLE